MANLLKGIFGGFEKRLKIQPRLEYKRQERLYKEAKYLEEIMNEWCLEGFDLQKVEISFWSPHVRVSPKVFDRQ